MDPFLTGGKGDTPVTAAGGGKGTSTAGRITICDHEEAEPIDGDVDDRPGALEDDRYCPTETGE